MWFVGLLLRCMTAESLLPLKLTPLQEKVLAKITLCRTAALGGHEEACDNCGTVSHFIRISIVSSRLPDTPWMADGKTSVMERSSFILFIR